MTHRAAGLFLTLIAAPLLMAADWGEPCDVTLTALTDSGLNQIRTIARCRYVGYNDIIITSVGIDGVLNVAPGGNEGAAPEATCSGSGTCGMSYVISPIEASQTYSGTATFTASELAVPFATKTVTGSVTTDPPQRPSGGGELPPVGCEGVCSPILIDLDGNDFHLTNADEGVSFDLNADGLPERVAWTRGEHADALLSLDRNGNGTVDNGAELFGNSVRLRSGAIARHGYEALQEFDAAANGGNGDGILDDRDAVWPALRVWLDSNHNGVSEAGELTAVPAAGVKSIDLDYHEMKRRDPYGNEFRYQSRAQVGDHREVIYDVFLIRQR